MLGHSGCGAVTGAVDAYLRPLKFWSQSTIARSLRSILQKIFVAVREAANGLKEVWGPDARDMPGYREALIETAVCINAAQAAFDLRQEIEQAGRGRSRCCTRVYNLHNHQVTMPVDPQAPPSDGNVHLAYAPTNPREFSALAIRMAEILRPVSVTRNNAAIESGANGEHPRANGPVPNVDRGGRQSLNG